MNYIHHIESYDHTNWCWAKMECEATVEEFGTASLSRLVSSPNVKSVFEKCRLQTYCQGSFLACSALQGMPSLSAHSRALCKNGTRKITNKTVIPMITVLCHIFNCRWTPFVTQTIRCVLCWLQHIGQILIYSESNITHLIKHWRLTNSSSSYDNLKNTLCGNYCIMCAKYTVNTRCYAIYLQSKNNDLWTMKYNSFLALTFVITKLYLPLRILRKP